VPFLCYEEDGNQTGIIHIDYCWKDEYEVEQQLFFLLKKKKNFGDEWKI